MRWDKDIALDAEKVCPAGEFDAAEILARRAQPPFTEQALAFIADFSAEILKNPELRRHPEIVALGFWMRRANVARLKASFEAAFGGRLLVGRGLAFHIAPANVDTMFIYSLFLALLAGNTNIVRISTKSNEQMAGLIGLLSKVLERHADMAKRLLVVRYGHDDKLTAFFSGVCNLRIIWGGDETIRRIRAAALPPHASELAFSGKFSVAALDAGAWNAASATEQARVARLFANDSFAFNQQGCASPKLVYWRGADAEVEKAREGFWPLVEREAGGMPFTLDAADIMDRFVAVCSTAVEWERGLEKYEARSHAFVRLKAQCLADVRRELNTGNGMFYEYAGRALDDLLDWFGDNDQTISSYGITIDDWRAGMLRRLPKGICRIVPIGRALEFSPVWDGHDLLRAMCREITLEV